MFLGVCDFPKRLVRVEGSPQSACRTAHCRRLYPRQILAGRKSLREIADAKSRPSAPARGSEEVTVAVPSSSREGCNVALRVVMLPSHSSHSHSSSREGCNRSGKLSGTKTFRVHGPHAFSQSSILHKTPGGLRTLWVRGRSPTRWHLPAGDAPERVHTGEGSSPQQWNRCHSPHPPVQGR